MHALKKRGFKRGLSQVVSTILIIALVFVAVGIISPVIIRIVRNSLEEKASCFAVMEELKISRQDAYNCYDEKERIVNITIHRGEIDLDKFYVTLIYEYRAETTEVKIDLDHGKEEEWTYPIHFSKSETPLKAEIFPEINGKKCDVTDFITLEKC